jgi:hypothetical protein
MYDIHKNKLNSKIVYSITLKAISVDRGFCFQLYNCTVITIFLLATTYLDCLLSFKKC